jgi:hypothetical protein
MEDQLENQAKDNTKEERKSRWQILFVDDHGKMITIKWFKPISVVVLSTLLLSIVLCIMFIVLFQSLKNDNRNITGEIEAYKNQIEAIQTEKDILMAKLVIAESKLNDMGKKEASQKKALPEPKKVKNKARVSQKKKISKPEIVPPQKKNMIKVDKDAIKTETIAPGNNISKTNIDKINTSKVDQDKNNKTATGNNAPDDEIINGVEIENLVFSHEPKIDLLRTKFIIKNISKTSEAISGFIFVIFKPDEKIKKDWFTIPSVGLVSGKPAFPKRGQYFKIHRFKTVHFKANRKINPELYKKATIFVFDENNNLLLRKTFPVTFERT